MAMAVDLIEETEAHEAAEPLVEASPKIGRSAFLYMEPRPGLDGLQYFRQCASCESFVPEAAMGAAVQGARCAKYGRDMVITDDDTCSQYYPFHAGLPCASVIDFNAAEIRKGLMSGPSAYTMGYKSQCDAKCRTCRFVDFGEPTLENTGKAECEAYESINECSPNIFALVKTINPNGGCVLWQAPEQMDAPAY